MLLGVLVVCVAGCGGGAPVAPAPTPIPAVVPAVVAPAIGVGAHRHHHSHEHQGHHHGHPEPDGCEHTCVGCCTGHAPLAVVVAIDFTSGVLIPGTRVTPHDDTCDPDPLPVRILHVPKAARS